MRIDKYRDHAAHQDFIARYGRASNAATGSEVDPNANVENKNIATLETEIYKRDAIAINRLGMYRKLQEMYGTDTAEEYLRQLEEHEIYRHDETGILGKPYTYGAKEAVIVKTPFGVKLVPLEDMYDMCSEPAVVVDTKNRVAQKYPIDWYVLDRNGYTKVTAITKKERHRDLVSVKTQFGEDVIVTDNHPMIVSDDVNDTVEAIDSLDKPQYSCDWDDDTVGAHIKDSACVAIGDNYNLYTIVRRGNYHHISAPNIKFDEDLGYFLGFFVAEGWFAAMPNYHSYGMMIKVKGTEDLHKCCDALFRSTGIVAFIQEHEDWRGLRTLKVSHPDFVDFCMNKMRLGRKAPEKKCPIDILEYPKSFRQGFIAGLIDGDGTLDDRGRALIRLSSRTCVSQLSYVLKSLGVPSSMTYGDYSGNEDALIKSSFPCFGIAFPMSDLFSMSRKYQGVLTKFNKHPSGWGKVRSVKPIQNEYFLRDNEFIYDITTESHSFMLNNIWVHNCASVTLYPFLFHGNTCIGGTSEAPKNLSSFNGAFINLVFALASQFCGAISTPEWLSYMDYFIRREYGEDYYLYPEKVADLSNRNRTVDKVITDSFEQVVYSLNQPAAARGNQSVFWNIAYFDAPYFKGMFEDFVFPDGTPMKWESVSWLQKRFMKWFNQERRRKLLTFPVETVNLLDDGTDYVDQEWADFTAEMWAEGHSFFVYRSDSVDSLASCCRLRNELQDNTFSYTLGAGGVATGSKCVMTINVNRLVQNAIWDDPLNDVRKDMEVMVEKVHKYLLAFNAILKERREAGLLPVYDAGFVTPEKQYLTIGINGFIEGAEALGIEPDADNPEYVKYAEAVLQPIYEANRRDRSEGIMWNTEQVPAENLGVKNATWDKAEKLFVPRDCYNSYFFRVEDPKVNVLDKLKLHGRDFTRYLDGGSACHINLDEHLTKEQYALLLRAAIRTGCNYLTFNVPNTLCRSCGYISKRRLDKCPKCGSDDLDYATRVIGYLKLVSRFAEARQEEAERRHYSKGLEDDHGPSD